VDVGTCASHEIVPGSIFEWSYQRDSTFSQGRKAVQAMIWSIVSFVTCLSGSSGCHLMRIDGFLAAEYPYREVRVNFPYVSPPNGCFGPC
jgi:hypothetical protein